MLDVKSTYLDSNNFRELATFAAFGKALEIDISRFWLSSTALTCLLLTYPELRL